MYDIFCDIFQDISGHIRTIGKAMGDRGHMEQNTIAVIWDFDKTLVDGYMQRPIFDAYHVDEKAFWQEVEALKSEYANQGIRVNNEKTYLNHMITCTRQGIFKGLNNRMLFDFGDQLSFYPGVPEVFDELKRVVSENPAYQRFGIAVEHYVVSTGFAEMIRGSKISSYIDGVWGCEFIEQPIMSKLGSAENADFQKPEISQIGYAIDHTTKTRALFEINKGSNKFNIDVNAKIADRDRRIPFKQMIYIADGPSDVPAFSVISRNGGKALAVYPKGSKTAMTQVNRLLTDGRVNMLSEADYSMGTTTFLWLSEQIDLFAREIAARKEKEIDASVSDAPQHID